MEEIAELDKRSRFLANGSTDPKGGVELRLIPAGFGMLISVGTLLLMLPWCRNPGKPLSWIDSLFLSTSSVCVTGLSTINVGETFNWLGQAVILILIQAGGLGIFTGSILLVLASGRRLSLVDEQTIQATVGKLKNARPADVFIYACVFVLVIEMAGAIALFLELMESSPGTDAFDALWQAIFHSVSAFCNAGISTFPEGLVKWRDNSELLMITCFLVILGGIGLMSLVNLRYYYFWRRDPRRRGKLTMQTRLSVAMALVLLVIGTFATWVFELDYTLKNTLPQQQISWAFFHSCMARTAGYNAVDVGQMNPPTLLVTMGLMFVGGAPGSMAGGIKTITFLVLLLTSWSALRRRDEIQFWNRRIPTTVTWIATMIALMAVFILLIGIGLLMLSENGRPSSQTDHRWLALMFEAVSAFGTVGLSTGVTPMLTSFGKFIIIGLMFMGRIAPLLLAIFLARPANPIKVRHPREELSLG